MCANFAQVPFLTAEKGERSFRIFGLRMLVIPAIFIRKRERPAEEIFLDGT